MRPVTKIVNVFMSHDTPLTPRVSESVEEKDDCSSPTHEPHPGNAAIAPGVIAPKTANTNAFHSAPSHVHEEMWKATAKPLGITLTGLLKRVMHTLKLGEFVSR